MGHFLSWVFFVHSEIKTDILVCPNKSGAWESCEPNVKQRVVKVIEYSKSTEAIVELGEEHGACEDKSFEEIQGNQECHSLGSKLSTVPEHKPVEPLEVRNSVVTELSSLVSFLTHNSNTDMRWLNHIDIVTAISDRKSVSFFIELLNKVDNGSFVIRRRSEHDDSSYLIKNVADVGCAFFVFKDCAESSSIKHYSKFVFLIVVSGGREPPRHLHLGVFVDSHPHLFIITIICSRYGILRGSSGDGAASFTSNSIFYFL